ncbi:BrnA antitoxin family protein [Shinella pollutisoli]|uniref:BrnA antitoxin family protein n=1 Tax=Shinella pollutisoli TaxID=2250594 RepID=A0ABV7DMA5_9HYPH|nr:BrnA antitoxin family protein [Shinella pollutisoli]
MSRLPRHLRDIDDAEEAEIQRQIAGDPDDEELSEKSARRPMTFGEAVRRKRGRPPAESPRRQVSIRLDPDVIEYFKATGKGWQARMNDALRKAAGL